MESRAKILSPGAKLEPTLRSYMESRFGADFGDVRIHTGRADAFLCQAIQAHAFTRGPDIFFGEGQYAPDTLDGRLLLAHELVHILQQRAAGPRRAPPPVTIGSPRDPCEREADRL